MHKRAKRNEKRQRRREGRGLFQSLGVTVCLSMAIVGSVLLETSVARAGEIAMVVNRSGHVVFVNSNAPLVQPTAKGISPHPVRIDKIVRQAARQHHVDPKLIRAVIQVESGYNPNAVSDKGAEGLMQLIPSTAERFGVSNPFNARQNIEGGASYLHYLLKLFGGNVRLALAAYNAGEHTVLDSGGIPRIHETERYVRKVSALYKPAKRQALKHTQPPTPPVREFVDAEGVVHFTNTE